MVPAESEVQAHSLSFSPQSLDAFRHQGDKPRVGAGEKLSFEVLEWDLDAELSVRIGNTEMELSAFWDRFYAVDEEGFEADKQLGSCASNSAFRRTVSISSDNSLYLVPHRGSCASKGPPRLARESQGSVVMVRESLSTPNKRDRSTPRRDQGGPDSHGRGSGKPQPGVFGSVGRGRTAADYVGIDQVDHAGIGRGTRSSGLADEMGREITRELLFDTGNGGREGQERQTQRYHHGIKAVSYYSKQKLY